MNIKAVFFLGIIACLASCSGNDQPTTSSNIDLRKKADSLAHAFILIDTHVDVPYRLQHHHFKAEGAYLDELTTAPEGDFDYERAQQGGLNAPFMSIYIPSRYQLQDDMGKLLADSLIDMIVAIADSLPTKFALANSPTEIEHNFSTGKISLPMGMENGAPIGKDINNVKYFFDRGIRYVTLTHGKDNQICDSSYDTLNTWNGLSPFGEGVVKAMNEVGIMVDISHVSDSTFYDVLKITKAPLIASHSSCRYFTPCFQRNMSDDMIKALGKNGGVIQINFGASFLDSTVRQNKVLIDSLGKILADKKLTSNDSAAQPIIDQFAKEHKALFSDVERVADHIDHVVSLIGIDHVGIGSDFDGVGDSLPVGLKDVSDYPNLIYVLLQRGYTAEDIQKICSGNILRVWRDVIEVAAGS